MDVISTRNVTKIYRAGVGRARIREMLPSPVDRAARRLFPNWWDRHTFRALDDVSLSVERGSSLGIVGHNGAGKTTLLKVMAGVTEPTEGTVEVSAKIAALIDALVGFHPDLTGRENVFLLGAMHGIGRRRIAPKLDRILEFAEIDELADTPLKRFSAGMAARLGFATITALDAEVLMVDEVLAVGDAGFQRKCINWLDEYRAGGGTLLFVSHNMSLVRNMTERVVWLDHGRVMADGPTREVLTRYAKQMERRDTGKVLVKKAVARKAMRAHGLSRWGAGGARVDEVFVDQPSADGDELNIAITYDAPEVEKAVFCVGFVDEAGREIGATVSEPMILEGERGEVRCTIRPLPLRSGVYFPVVAILGSEGLILDRWKLDRPVVVDRDGEALSEFGPVDISAGWSSP